MKIPKYSDIDPNLRDIDLDDLFDLLMCDLATHDIKSALVDLVVYIRKSGFDLSKEILALSKHPYDSDVITRVAKRVCRFQDDKFLKYVNQQMKGKHKSKGDYKREPSVSGHKSEMSLSDADAMMMGFRDKIVNLLNRHKFSSIDLVAVDKDGHLVSLGLNSEGTLSQINLGLDALKYKLIRGILSNGHGTSGGYGHFGGPNKPSSKNPVDQAVDILNQLDL